MNRLNTLWTVLLTGGIASGKSTVSDLLASKGVCILDADQIARELTQPGSQALEAIQQHLGHTWIDHQGQLKRQALHRLISTNPDAKQWLENLLHPPIVEILLKRLQACPTHAPYCVLVIPLLIETGLHKTFPHDRIAVIDAPEKQQRQRLTQRNALNDQQMTEILHMQCSRKARLACAHEVILNDGDHQHLQQQVEIFHHNMVYRI